jgi:hypothetical protein
MITTHSPILDPQMFTLEIHTSTKNLEEDLLES